MDDDLPEVSHDVHHKFLIIGGIVFVVFILVAVIFAFMGQAPKQTTEKDSARKTTSDESGSIENNSLLVQTQFMYAQVDTTQQKTTIFRRPEGADVSQKVIEVSGVFKETQYTRLSGNVAFAIGQDVYTSSDSGISFKKIFTSRPSEEVTSLRFSKHKAKLLVAVTNAYGNVAGTQYGNHLYKMDVDGANQEKVLELSDVGVFIKDWSIESGNILYQSGCNKCDQATRTSAIYSVKTKKTINLPVQDGNRIGNLALNDAGTKTIYSTALHDPTISVYGSLKNGYYGPPYEIRKYDINNKQDRVVQKIGKRLTNPKSYDVIPLQPLIATAGTKYGRQHYYLYDGKITLLYDDNHTEYLMDAPKNLKDVLFVSEEQVLVTIKNESGWKLVSFIPSSKSQQVLFEATSNDIPLGMSDQF